MSAILEKIKLHPNEEQAIHSENAKTFVKIMKLHEELERERTRIFSELTKEEKEEAFAVIKKTFSIPEYVTVKDAAEIVGVSAQMIRKYCSEEKFKSKQSMPGSGKWRIETSQLMDYPGWNEFVGKRIRIKNQSLKIADYMVNNINLD